MYIFRPCGQFLAESFYKQVEEYTGAGAGWFILTEGVVRVFLEEVCTLYLDIRGRGGDKLDECCKVR